jgi:alpha-tubulin suppressor-like RCC1 family protein
MTLIRLRCSLVVGLPLVSCLSVPPPPADKTCEPESDVVLRSIALAPSYACAITEVGAVLCWGANDYRLGAGDRIDRTEPKQVPLPGAALQLALAGNHGCALLEDGAVNCWGANGDGQLGIGGFVPSTSGPVPVTGLGAAVAVSAGQDTSCALLGDGTVWCWGHNSDRQLGDGTTTPSPVPLQIPGLVDVVDVSVGIDGTVCARTAAKELFCWGENDEGELGLGFTSSNEGTPQQVSSLSEVTDIAVQQHVCAVTGQGEAYCWGRNWYGELGTSNGSSPSPRLVPIAVRLVAVAPGYVHTCGLAEDGSVWCWGSNLYGQLGTGSSATTAIPAQVQGLPGPAVQLVSGGNTTCALTEAGRAYCWGSDAAGQVRLSSTLAFPTPALVAGLPPITQISAGGGRHSCALAADGAAWCWGNNESGQLGNATQITASEPVQVLAGATTTFSQLAVGAHHSCGITDAGVAMCWGSGYSGQLGVGSYTATTTPAPIAGTDRFVAVGAHASRSCAIRTDNQVFCWGVGPDGGPSPGTLGLDLRALAVGQRHSCGLQVSDGALLCWGANSYGQLSDGTDIGDGVRQVDLTGVTAVAAGDNYSCAIAGAQSSCWGNNNGSLGTGDTADTATPRAIATTLTFTALDGGSFTCGVTSEQEAYCWGDNPSGQLGDGGLEFRAAPSIPVAVAGSVVHVAVGDDHACALISDGQVACWGSDRHGAVGVGRAVVQSLPRDVFGCADVTSP